MRSSALIWAPGQQGNCGPDRFFPVLFYCVLLIAPIFTHDRVLMFFLWNGWSRDLLVQVPCTCRCRGSGLFCPLLFCVPRCSLLSTSLRWCASHRLCCPPHCLFVMSLFPVLSGLGFLAQKYPCCAGRRPAGFLSSFYF